VSIVDARITIRLASIVDDESTSGSKEGGAAARKSLLKSSVAGSGTMSTNRNVNDSRAREFSTNCCGSLFVKTAKVKPVHILVIWSVPMGRRDNNVAVRQGLGKRIAQETSVVITSGIYVAVKAVDVDKQANVRAWSGL
jgi:hypothetical protein